MKDKNEWRTLTQVKKMNGAFPFDKFFRNENVLFAVILRHSFILIFYPSLHKWIKLRKDYDSNFDNMTSLSKKLKNEHDVKNHLN